MVDATKTTARHIGHMTYTQAPGVYEKNIFHLFRFTQPVKNYSFQVYIIYYYYSFICIINVVLGMLLMITTIIIIMIFIALFSHFYRYCSSL